MIQPQQRRTRTSVMLCIAILCAATVVRADALFGTRLQTTAAMSPVAAVRGGASTATDSLSESTLKSVSKAKKAATASSKDAVNQVLKPSKSKKSKSLFKFIPYIIRASLNPFTLAKMTKLYFVTLFNPYYMQKKSSAAKAESLRSILEEKAKRDPGGGKGKRKMKPGQAKTLSDLPKLNT